MTQPRPPAPAMTPPRGPAHLMSPWSPHAPLLAITLARWGFTWVAVLSVMTTQPGPFLISAPLAAYAWMIR
ncbi:hypothetical protein MBT84_29500 [Streptomyces sp. MBT84]|nr:hypothetical protein [Streptomyces sp. MBT84]